MIKNGQWLTLGKRLLWMRDFAHMAAACGASLALGEQLHLIEQGRELTFWADLFFGLSSTAIAGFLVCFFLTSVLTAAIGSFTNLDRRAFAIALIVFLNLRAVYAILAEPGEESATPRLLFGLVSICLCILLYFFLAAKGSEGGQRIAWLALMGLPIPFGIVFGAILVQLTLESLALRLTVWLLLLWAVALLLRRILPLSETKLAWASLVIFLTVLVSPTFGSGLFRVDKDQTHAGIRTLAPVVLITIDTLRADSLSRHDEFGSLTPNLDRLANKSIVFSNAYSAAPWTLPAVVSIMTGVPTTVHQAQGVLSGLPEQLPTLAEILSQAGYRTIAIVRNAFLRPSTGLNRGFDEYRQYPLPAVQTLGEPILNALFREIVPTDQSTAQLGETAVELLGSLDGGFFLWVHFFDPHSPFSPPRELLRDHEPVSSVGDSFDSVLPTKIGFYKPDQNERAWIRRLYDLETKAVDEQIGRILDTLQEQGLFEKSLVIVTSDHGEEFWEHDSFEHGHSVYDEVIKVPLIVKPAMSREARTVDSVVSTASLMGTILDLCGVEHTLDHLEPSLKTTWDDTEIGQGGLGAITSTGQLYSADHMSVRFGRYKYIVGLVDGREQLYDLVSDPGEQYSLAGRDLDALRLARSRLAELQETAARTRESLGLSKTEPVWMEPKTLERLRSLGYVQ